MKLTLYLEPTVPSYYVARPSRDIIVLAHQEITRKWWEQRLPLFDVYISPLVLEESRQDDQDQARRRLQILAEYPILGVNPEVERLARIYMQQLGLPGKAIRDAAHIAFACAYGIEYLVTWNCAHIANAEIRRRLMEINSRSGIPIICTPEELMGIEEE